MKKVFVLGQAPPRVPAVRPFDRTALYTWLSQAGVSEEYIKNYFSFAALIDIFPGSKNGSHMKPSPQQIALARPNLLVRIKQVDPDIIIPLGILAIREVLQDSEIILEHTVGEVFKRRPFGVWEKDLTVIPFPHPSGASPWVHIGGHRELLKKALEILGDMVR